MFPTGIALTFAALLGFSVARSNLGGQGYVDLSVYGGTPDAKGAGVLYGYPNGPAYLPTSSPPRSAWAQFATGAGISWLRAGGAQIPFPGYAAYVQNGNSNGYNARFGSAKQNYLDFRALNPSGQFVLLPHDIWGADSVTGSTAIYPCDNGDCTQYGLFLDKLIGDLRSSNMTGGLHIDIWNEPDLGGGGNGGFWPRSQNQYLQAWDYAYVKYRAGFAGTGVQIVGPSTSSQPFVGNSWWENYASQIKATGNRFERTRIIGLRANWGSGVGLHNDFSKLVRPGGSDKTSNFYTLGDWHVLNYYTQMQRGLITLAGASISTCYYLYVTQERSAGLTHILAGSRGQTGSYPITVSNVNSNPQYNGKSKLRALFREIPFNQGGRVDTPIILSNNTIPVSNNQIVINLNMDLDSAYTIDLFGQ